MTKVNVVVHLERQNPGPIISSRRCVFLKVVESDFVPRRGDTVYYAGGEDPVHVTEVEWSLHTGSVLVDLGTFGYGPDAQPWEELVTPWLKDGWQEVSNDDWIDGKIV
jgi:hypothetical protein